MNKIIIEYSLNISSIIALVIHWYAKVAAFKALTVIQRWVKFEAFLLKLSNHPHA